MALGEAIGCALVAFGPNLWLVWFTVAADPVRVIVLTAAAFCWLLSLLCSSLLWFAVVPLRQHLVFGMCFSIVFQELFRFGVYKLLRGTENGLRQISDTHIVNNKHTFAYVSGLGFGMISGAFAFINVLADAVGPGTVGLKGGSNTFFLTSAFTTLCIILLHTFWSVIFFNALDEKDYYRLAWVIGSHFLVSSLTLLNRFELYYASIIPAYVVLLITIAIAYKSIGGTFASFKKGFSLGNII